MTPLRSGTVCLINRDGALDVSSSLVELNSLPRVLGCLRHGRTTLSVHRVTHSRLLLTALSARDVPFNLVLAESQRQVQLKRVVLATLGLVEPVACFIEVLHTTSGTSI